MHRVKREHHGDRARAWDPESPQDQPKHAGRRGVEADGHKMVAECVVAPDPVEHPEQGMEHRVVLLAGAEFEPDSEQACGRSQLRRGHVPVVVPEHAAVPGWSVCHERQRQKEGQLPEVAPPEAVRRRAGTRPRRQPAGLGFRNRHPGRRRASVAPWRSFHALVVRQDGSFMAVGLFRSWARARSRQSRPSRARRWPRPRRRG